MTQPEPITPPAVEPVVPQAGPPMPPWGTAEEFNPDKAWQLIQNLRGDLGQKAARIAELTPYEQQARAAEEANKTEVQRLNDQLAAERASAATAQIETLRLRVALQYGIPDDDAAIFLTAGDEATLKAQAERLASMRAPVAPPPTTQRTPVEALRPGALPNVPPPSLDEQITAAQKAGDVRTVIALQNQKLANYIP